MSERLQQFVDRQHNVLGLVTVWLAASSPWLGMLRRIPADAGWLDYAHVLLGFAALVLAATYTWSCSRDGKWRLYFPVLPAQAAAVGRDVAGLLRGRRPAAEAGGLFGLIEGLLLVALAATAASGAAWFFQQGTPAALAWRALHVDAAHACVVVLVLHVMTVSLHLLDFIGD